ncbi:MAG: ribonuclease D [Neomegalonema sp.]
MRIVTSHSELAALVEEYSDAPYVTVDTEFVRERTFWPVLCLIQIARPTNAEPGSAEAQAASAIIDPIRIKEKGSDDLSPLFELMRNEKIVKVFHAARQDVEIFVRLSGEAPKPLFDTQIAAMVCGFGDQVGYETLVRKVAKTSLDKSSRFTDWARRPLSEKQLRYAMGDVTHLRAIYEHLKDQIERSGRAHWVAEEMAALADASGYIVEPDEAWKRLKTRSTSGRFLAVAKELAAWREREAQGRDIPRNRLLKDDALLEIAANQPKTLDELSRSRLLFREARKGEVAEEILSAVRRGLDVPKDLQPRVEEPRAPRNGAAAVAELLRVLLKAKAEESGVAQRLLATSADLDAIANDDEPDVPALSGWRREAFGETALRLKRGEIGLAVTDGAGRSIDL